jgi:hypothetical protein
VTPIFRYDKYMPEVHDLTLIVLKGHLLVEELLVDLANDALPHPQYLEDAKLTFHNLACIVRAAVPQKSSDLCWRLIFSLNTLRNDLAHKLESSKREARLDEIFRILDSVAPEWNCISDTERLRLAVQITMEFLLSISFEYDRKRHEQNS